MASLVFCAWKTPLMIEPLTLSNAELVELVRVRSASASADGPDGPPGPASSRAIGKRRVRGGVKRCCALSPASGPRHDVPAVLVSMNVVHARGQLEQAQRVTRRRRVEHTWSNRARGVRSPSELRELVERRDLDRARARQLLLDAGHGAAGSTPR